MVLLLSPATLAAPGDQWTELAYADAFDVDRFILLHRVTRADVLQQERGIPALILSANCVLARDWRGILPELRTRLAAPLTEARHA